MFAVLKKIIQIYLYKKNYRGANMTIYGWITATGESRLAFNYGKQILNDTTVHGQEVMEHLKYISPTFVKIPNIGTNVEFTTVCPSIAKPMLSVRAIIDGNLSGSNLFTLCSKSILIFFLKIRWCLFW